MPSTQVKSSYYIYLLPLHKTINDASESRWEPISLPQPAIPSINESKLSHRNALTGIIEISSLVMFAHFVFGKRAEKISVVGAKDKFGTDNWATIVLEFDATKRWVFSSLLWFVSASSLEPFVITILLSTSPNLLSLPSRRDKSNFPNSFGVPRSW